MSTAVQYYLSLRRGGDVVNLDTVVAASSSNLGPGTGAAGDVEVRLSIDNGTSTTGLTREDAVNCLRIIEAYILSGGAGGSGALVPAL